MDFGNLFVIVTTFCILTTMFISFITITNNGPHERGALYVGIGLILGLSLSPYPTQEMTAEYCMFAVIMVIFICMLRNVIAHHYSSRLNRWPKSIFIASAILALGALGYMICSFTQFSSWSPVLFILATLIFLPIFGYGYREYQET